MHDRSKLARCHFWLKRTRTCAQWGCMLSDLWPHSNMPFSSQPTQVTHLCNLATHKARNQNKAKHTSTVSTCKVCFVATSSGPLVQVPNRLRSLVPHGRDEADETGGWALDALRSGRLSCSLCAHGWRRLRRNLLLLHCYSFNIINTVASEPSVLFVHPPHRAAWLQR